MVQQTTITTTATSATENAITIDSIKSQLSNFPKLTEYLSYFVHLSEAIPASKQNLTENGAYSEDEEDDLSSSKYWKQTSTENKQNLKFLQKTNQKVKKANGDDNESDGEDDDDEEEEGQEVINGKSLIDDEAAEDDDSVSDEDDGSDESSDDEEERITTQKSKQQQKSQPKKNRKTNDNMIFNALKTGDVASATTKHSVLTNGASATGAAATAAHHDKNAVDAAPSANSKKRKNRPLTAEQLLKEKQSKKQKLIEQSDVNPQKAINDYTRDQLESAMIRSEHGRDNKAVKVLQSKVKKERAKKKKSKKEWDQRVKNQSTQQQQKIEKRAANIRAKKSRGKKEEPSSSSSGNATAAAANKTQKRNRPGFEGKRGKPINGINKLKNIQQQSKQQQKK